MKKKLAELLKKDTKPEEEVKVPEIKEELDPSIPESKQRWLRK